MDASNLIAPISVLWIGSELLLMRMKHSGGESTQKDKHSVRILWLVIVLAIASGVFVRMWGPGRLAAGSAVMNIAGLVLIVAGLALRWVAVLTLKNYFTVDVAIMKDHRIIQSGVYKYIRHPSYAGAILSFVGLGVSFSNWISLIIMSVAITLAFLHRIRIEEAALLEHFGDDYRRYCSSTRRLIPNVY
ncbi:MAG TPA: isoprenylcysteine carboxylmethyltransferase family protein [Bacteroidota bacterium]|nr:isoprenylcysteine carboxylmethyltransferase family protein [Bacteroidota bacterium]